MTLIDKDIIMHTLQKLASLLFATLIIMTAPLAGTAFAATIKQSNSGICHDANSRWYDRTKNFKSYGSMQECMRSGRAYKGYSGNAATAPVGNTTTSGIAGHAGTAMPYDRDLYDHWIDEDRDCQNARHEFLIENSTGPVTFNTKGCSVIHGRWNDPYTGMIFTNARDMDIDHMVPLAWAHAHGADQWSRDLRRQFANDPANLFAVQASANRSKGAKGPLQWLPPNNGFHCQYVTRFHRIVLTYKLQYTAHEQNRMAALRTRVCG